MRNTFRRKLLTGALVAGVAAGLLGVTGQPASAIEEWSSSVEASDGTIYYATNHLTEAANGPGRKWLLAWTGSVSGPDFLAVIDATPHSPHYGKVANTVTFDPGGVGNEPHHMQYVWHKGDRIFAGGIISDTVFVLDATHLPSLKLVGVNIPTDTPCGTLPDAFHVLSDGSAYGTYMGGPNLPGACTYSNGEVRIGNGAGGSPGEVVRISPEGVTLAEIPAATAAGEDPEQCANVPTLPAATCANPHGLAVREDLNRMIASDFAEARNFLSPTAPLVENLARQTIRIFDITDRNDPELVSVSRLEDGPRTPLEPVPFFRESRVVMETAVTHRSRHRGAFASSMAGGAVFYTPDITVPNPQWREIFDDTTAYATFHRDGSVRGGGDNSSWLYVSPDDRFLFHAVMGQSIPYGQPLNITTGMIYVLDIRKLLAAGKRVRCDVDTLREVFRGGRGRDCPELVGVMPIRDVTPGGPHWGALDNFRPFGKKGYREAFFVRRFAVANYFVEGSFGGGGDHRVCMFDLSHRGSISLDETFRDEHTGEPCVDFNRQDWPHGAHGDSRPHGVLIAVTDAVLR